MFAAKNDFIIFLPNLIFPLNKNTIPFSNRFLKWKFQNKKEIKERKKKD